MIHAEVQRLWSRQPDQMSQDSNAVITMDAVRILGLPLGKGCLALQESVNQPPAAWAIDTSTAHHRGGKGSLQQQLLAFE